MVKNNIRKSLLEQGQLLSDKFIIDANNVLSKKQIIELKNLNIKNYLLGK